MESPYLALGAWDAWEPGNLRSGTLRIGRMRASAQELAFLTLLNFNTNVRRAQYAKYYYALEDVSRGAESAR